MKNLLIYILLFFGFQFSMGQQIVTSSSALFTDCKIDFVPSLNYFDIKKVYDDLDANCDFLFDLDLALKTEDIDFKKLRQSPKLFNFRPSIQDLFSTPSFQLGDYNEFEQGYRFSNPAFYEANKNSVLSMGYQSFVPATGGAGF